MSLSNCENPLAEWGVYYLCGDIDEENAKTVVDWILMHGVSKRPDVSHLTLLVSSDGGLVNSAFSIIDVMRGSRLPVHTVGLGIVSSAGLLIFMSGEPGYRTLTPNTEILSHQFSAADRGKEHELIAGRDRFDLLTKKMMRVYRNMTGLDDEEIREELLPPEDRWLTARQAKRMNLCDRVASTW